MVYAMGADAGNSLLDSHNRYAAKYTGRRHPQVKWFEFLNEWFERTCHIEYEKKCRAKIVLTDENQLADSFAVVGNSESSLSEISRDLVILKSSFARSVKNIKFHPY